MKKCIALLLALILTAALLTAALAEEVTAPAFEAVEEQDEVALPAPEDAVDAPVALEAPADIAPKAAVPAKLTLGKGETYTVSVADIKSCKSSDTTVATVSKKGKITAKKVSSKAVTITITDTKGSKTTVKVTVKKAPKSLALNRAKKTLAIGKTYQLKATLPSGTASNRITWTSSDRKVAKVSSSGKVTAVKAGTAEITATAFNGTAAACVVTVKAPKLKIGVSMPTDAFARWQNDGGTIKAGLEKAGYDVVLKFANNKPATQAKQVNAMIDDGCAALVIAGIESSALTDALSKARDSGIPVVAYDRLLMDSDGVSAYVTFGATAVGKVQGRFIRDALGLDTAKGSFNIEFTAGDPGDANARAFFDGAMSILKPYIKSGKLVVISGQTSFAKVATEWWRTDNAQARAERLLADFYADNTRIDAWLCSNDSTALGVIAALDKYYAASTWPIITGQDCDLENVRLIIAGKQAMSVFKDTKDLADRAVTMVKQLATGKKLKVNDTKTCDNGAVVVPAYLCTPGYVTTQNYMQMLVESGYYSKDDLQ